MAKKSKKAKKNKKANPKKKLWHTEDLDFDEDGNLCVKNAALSKALKRAIYRTDRRFKIKIHCKTGVTDVDQPGVHDTMDSKTRKKGDVVDGKQATADDGRPPMDAMCPC